MPDLFDPYMDKIFYDRLFKLNFDPGAIKKEIRDGLHEAIMTKSVPKQPAETVKKRKLKMF